jgi:hypothetical protein
MVSYFMVRKKVSKRLQQKIGCKVDNHARRLAACPQDDGTFLTHPCSNNRKF